MIWLAPWSSAEQHDDSYRAGVRDQLQREVAPGHFLYGLPVRLVGRGNGDDALFALLDGSGRVAQVHFTWARSQQCLPWLMKKCLYVRALRRCRVSCINIWS